MKYYIITLIGLIASTVSFARNNEPTNQPGSAAGNNDLTLNAFNAKANCPPSTAKLFMNFNDINALIEVGGLLWENRATTTGAYEIPEGSGQSVIFAGSIWMGGVDVNGQLKLAAVTYRSSGNDFWGGPLSITTGSGNFDPSLPVGDDVVKDFGGATIAPETCLEYDKFFTIRKSEVILFSLEYECSLNPDCEDVFDLSADARNRINNWPAHPQDLSLNQDYYLAPFYDNDQDGSYDPTQGDYPWYDDILGKDDIECLKDRRISLFGDETHWWVFNDKGNIHTESNGDPIGMEIHAQAFAFATNDEVNQMTFYNYEMINRGTQTLFDTYFTQYVDADIGGSLDDYVGCDVSRGLGFAYNADAIDENQGASIGYGENPPAVGIDFFEGPYQDADGKDNVGPHFAEVNGVITYIQPSVNEALADEGIVYPGIGIGYSDGIVDNERFGMRRFNYYSRSGTAGNANQSDPSTPSDFYNYMNGRWKNSQDFVFGGNAFAGTSGATEISTNFVYPGDSDPLAWGTLGLGAGTLWDWSENDIDGSGTAAETGDRRFLQSAGPFTLTPGAVNNLTVGVVYGRSFSGDPTASVDVVKRADTKAQALFDNCFRILEPPSAPILKVQELQNELILTISNPLGNNVNEEYIEEDKINIVDPGDGTIYDKFYRFEGYQIYQMVDANASVSDIGDVDKARLVAQCDVENDVDRLINFDFNDALGVAIPSEKVNGENKGIRHSFQIKEDLFAQGDRTLVNNRTYYYVATAYAFNQYKEYDPNDPQLLDGQKLPYLSSRLSADGGAIKSLPAIPHIVAPEAGGTVAALAYGEAPIITRLDGRGNGGKAVELSQESKDAILQNNTVEEITYTKTGAPIDVKVIDPLNVADGVFTLNFVENDSKMDTSKWVITRTYSGGTEQINSQKTIAFNNEQLIPKWGISVTIEQANYYSPGYWVVNQNRGKMSEPIEATIDFADSSKAWLRGVPDNDGFGALNWIKSGTYTTTDPADPTLGYRDPTCYIDLAQADDDKLYTQLLGGTVTAGLLARSNDCGYSPIGAPGAGVMTAGNFNGYKTNMGMAIMPSVDIVITSDKSKWTRCPVLELNNDVNLSIGGAKAGTLRGSPSTDRNGLQVGEAGYNDAEATLGGLQPTGMGWFPGYAIDVESGKRVDMAFGENSFLVGENGGDMIWNPTSRFFSDIGEPRLGGQHVIYIFGGENEDHPAYEQDQTYMYDKLNNESTSNYKKAYTNLSWVLYPILEQGQDFLSTDVNIRLRINKRYEQYVATNSNGGYPSYKWDMESLRTTTQSNAVLASALDLINVVPNPYYAFSQYENSRLDTRVKITNLPEVCNVKIYNTTGKLIRSYKKSDPVTSIDWDLKNGKGIPIASGAYIIHVEVPGVGETVVKFFGGLRQVDLENI